MEKFKSHKIKSVLKTLLKKKSLTYEELGAKLECSVPTVKRILGSEELSLNRLLKICGILDIDLAELETLTKSENVKEAKFTEAQEVFLVKNKSYFAYLMKIFGGETPKQIAASHGLSQRSTDKYLINLEKQGLVHVTGAQRVRSTFKAAPNLGNGDLAKSHFESLIEGGSQFFVDLIHGELNSTVKLEERVGSKFSIFSQKVSKETYQAWAIEKNKALNEFSRLAAFEEKTKDSTELMTVVLLDAHALVDNNYRGLKALDNSLGEIVNL